MVSRRLQYLRGSSSAIDKEIADGGFSEAPMGRPIRSNPKVRPDSQPTLFDRVESEETADLPVVGQYAIEVAFRFPQVRQITGSIARKRLSELGRAHYPVPQNTGNDEQDIATYNKIYARIIDRAQEIQRHGYELD